MRVEVTPNRLTALPGTPVVLTVTVTNTGDVISGHSVRVLGVDPRWVELSEERLSLFPGGTAATIVTLTLPPGLPAGQRRLSIQVRELTPPESTAVVDVDLDLPPVQHVDARIEPSTVTAGRRGSFGMLVENSGNTGWSGSLVGSDEESKVKFRFFPPTLALAPGEHAAVEVAVRARRRLFGQMVVRPLSVRLPAEHAGPDEEPTEARGTFMQRPVVGRGALSLGGLLVAVTIFALVITYALSGVVGRSAADRDLALQVAQADQSSSTSSGTASIAGTVRLLTSGAGVPGVTVEIFDASDTANPVISQATDDSGAYTLAGLGAGSYKLQFRGAGFAELWYPQALTDADAGTITVQDGQAKQGVDVRLGGLPATISGTITGGDPTGATVSLLLPGSGVSTGSGSTASSVTVTSASGTPAGDGATVESVKVGGDGAFSLGNVPSPSVYDLAVAKTGFATDVERIDVGGGEQRTGLQIRLQQGNGLIAGLVSSTTGPLGGATISAQYNGTTVQTVSLTDAGKVGQFTLRGLPTPGNFTVVVSAPNHSSQTLDLSLTSGQQLKGVGVTLGDSAGALGGTVTTSDGTDPSGVSVTVTNGSLTVQTVTNSGSGTAGRWSVAGLPLPGTYTITFARSDLSPQTLAVSLDSFGHVKSGSASSASAVDTVLSSATASLSGRTMQLAANNVTSPATEALVTVTSGTSTYSVTSASVPAAKAGDFEIDHLLPGTYTLTTAARGARPTSRIVTLAAGQPQSLVLTLAAPAGIHGVVRDATGAVLPHAEVRLYLATDYPGTSLQTVEAGDDGSFSFADLDAPQNYVVEEDYPAGTSPRASKTVTLNESEDLEVDLQPAPTPTSTP
jgi:hypothetical protein